MNTTLLRALAAIALASATSGDDPEGIVLAARYPVGRTVRVRTESSYKMTRTTVDTFVDGVREGAPLSGGYFQQDYSVVEVDEVVEGGDLAIRRRYDSASALRTESTGRGTREYERGCPLVGVTLSVSRDAGGTEVAVAAGEDPHDAEALESQRPDYPLDLLLPDEPVKPGDRWQAEGGAVRELLEIDRMKALFPYETKEGRRRGFSGAMWHVEQSFEACEWKVDVVYEEKDRVVDGRKLDVLAVTVEGYGFKPGKKEARTVLLPGGKSVVVEEQDEEEQPPGTHCFVNLTGTLLFDRERGLPVGFELSGEHLQDTRRTWDRGASTVVERGIFEGYIRFSMKLALEE